MDRTLREITSAVGTPLTIDNATSKRLYGHYARILVDMDCSKKLFYEILVERDGFSFPVEVVYEWMPDFCTHCQNLGHHVTSCRWLYPRKDAIEPAAKIDKGKTKAPVKNIESVPLQTNPSGIGSSNAFAALETNTKVTETETVRDIADNTFSFPLQNVVDHVPQRTLPQVTEPVLTLAMNVAQDDVVGDEVHSGSGTKSPVVSIIPLISAEEHDQVNDETDRTTPQSDVILLQIELQAAVSHDNEVEDVSSQVPTDSQIHKELAAMTFTFENVDIAIHHDTLPSTSPHVLEKIIEEEIETQ